MAAASSATKLRAKEWAKLRLRALFEIGQRVGVDILPRHFYSEIPDIRTLKNNRAWQRPYSLAGVRGIDVDRQLTWLRTVCPPALASRLAALHLQQQAADANEAVGYGPIESDLLYCIVHTLKPRRMIQVGAGASTWVALKAADDAGADIEITCVDPFPTRFLTALRSEGRIRLRHRPVQELPVEELADLAPGDILFVDSTHTVSAGSDVNYVILEVLPKLRKGTLVHFHDITMPYDYPPSILSKDLFFWTESVLLHAYLADNPRFELRAGCALLHERALSEVQEIIPTYTRPMRTEHGLAVSDRDAGAYPTSLWLEVVADPG
jgi:predicted O-methyltransferase YrrM